MGCHTVAAPTLAALPAIALAGRDTRVKRRRLLGHAAAVMVATAVLAADGGRTLSRAAPTPGRIGTADVTRVEVATRALRAVDYRCGGGACCDALAAQLSWAQRLLGAVATPQVRQRLLRALGDLHDLAGWTAFDVGLVDGARRCFATAVDYARQAGAFSLLANIVYRIGRVCVHYGQPDQALRWVCAGSACRPRQSIPVGSRRVRRPTKLGRTR